MERNPGDLEIRSLLRSTLFQRHAAQSNTVIIEELGVCRGQARIDLSVINGSLHGYEIKSDRDSLQRLRNQAELYGKVVDRATLVLGSRHLPEACSILPP